nr:DUF4249 domain-containing protein [Ancylomarina sp. DW003]
MLRKISFLIFLFCFTSSCVDPYHVDVKGYKDLLVVDALITNENRSHQVKLARSKANLDEEPIVESKAQVVIICNDGTEEILKEVEPGVYKTDSTKFIVEIGKIYKLKITTSSGKQYSSDECEILEHTEINRVFYKRQDRININNEKQEGINFFVDAKSTENTYLRWMYEEDWKFSILYPTLIGFDENKEVVYLPVQNFYCWKRSCSNEIIIQSLENQNSAAIEGKEVCFIPSDYTDRFYIKYSINIKQLNISKEEYNFWSKLKEASEEVGDIFGTQPFTITGNVKSDNDANEPVLGYFQTGSVVTKRVFLDYKDVARLELSLKNKKSMCELDTIPVDNFTYNSLYEIYEEQVLKRGRGLHDQPMGDFGPMNALLITDVKCTDCSQTGSPKKPSFWED